MDSMVQRYAPPLYLSITAGGVVTFMVNIYRSMND